MVIMFTCIVLLKIPVSATVTGTYGDFTYIIENNTVTITGYTDHGSTVVEVPETIDGYPVTKIGEGAFCKGATTKYYPIERITLPSTIEIIDDDAFYNCQALENINLDECNNITRIGCNAFSACHSLRSIYISDRIQTLDSCCFYDMQGLEEFTGGNSNIYTKDGVLYEGTKLRFYPNNKSGKRFVIPYGITEISSVAFYSNHTLTKLVIPSSVKNIGMSALASWTNAADIVFSHIDSLPSLNGAAFGSGLSNYNLIVKNRTLVTDMNTFLSNNGITGITVSVATDSNLIAGEELYLITNDIVASEKKTSSDLQLLKGSTASISVVSYPENNTDSITWGSSNSTVAKVNSQTGIITAVGYGTCIITACDEHEHRVEVQVTVYEPATAIDLSLSVNSNIITATTNNTTGLVYTVATVSPSNQTGTVKYISEDTGVVKWVTLKNGIQSLQVVGTGTTSIYAIVENEDGSIITSDKYIVIITTPTENENQGGSDNSSNESSTNNTETDNKVNGGNSKESNSTQKDTTSTNKVSTVVPSKVRGLKVSSYKATKVTLSWSKAKNATKYQLQQKVNGAWKTIKTLSNTSYTISKLVQGKTYSFRVRAYNEKSKKYSTSWTTINASTTPKTVSTYKKKSVIKNSITVKWSKVSGISGYQIQYSTSSKFTSKKTVKLSSKATLKKITNLKKNKTYYVRIRTYKVVGGKTYYGSYKTIKIKTSKR